jgi:hypothetical protein
LPRRWLWCCTWCSEFEKDEALIIDLANNPKTKSSKVEMAMKFIEEWPLLNDEAEHFADPEYFVQYNLTEIRAAHRELTGVEPEEEKPKAKKKKKGGPPKAPAPSQTAAPKSEEAEEEPDAEAGL